MDNALYGKLNVSAIRSLAKLRMWILILSILLFGAICSLTIGETRTFSDGIEKAEIHHLITGEYYNKYSQVITIPTEGDTIKTYVCEERESIKKTYWEEVE